MIEGCIETGRGFGIVLVGESKEETGEVRTARIGCVARIVKVERLPDGRMNIEVVGEERFRILDAHENQLWRTGVVEPYLDVPTEPERLKSLSGAVRTLLSEFLRLHLRRMRREATFQLPEEPGELSFIASCVLPIDNRGKQTLLEYSDAALRLAAVRDVLENEVARLSRNRRRAPRGDPWTMLRSCASAAIIKRSERCGDN